MKKIVVLAVLLVLLAVGVTIVGASPTNNPHGYWLTDVSCPGFAEGLFDVWVHNDQSVASFTDLGRVGVTKALYIDFGAGYELIWQVPGHGVFEHTVWCEWVLDEVPMAGEILTR